MPDDTVTISLQGTDVPLPTFVAAMQHFAKLMTHLANELAEGAAIQWIVDDLQKGSALVRLRARADDVRAVDRVIHAYDAVGQSLALHQVPPFSRGVMRESRAIVRVLGTDVPSVIFHTAIQDNIIEGPWKTKVPKTSRAQVAYGSVKGRVQTLTNRGDLKFTLYDTLYDRAVYCYLREGQEEMMRDLWGKKAIVEGRVSREPLTARPIAIRDIMTVESIPEVLPGSYRDARGVLAHEPGDFTPEQLIRQMRDA